VRERLVAAFVGLTVLIVALYGVPRAYVVADLVRSGEQARVHRTAQALSAALDTRLADGDPVTTGYLDTLADTGEQLTYRSATGEVVASSLPGGAAEKGQVSGGHDLSAGGRISVTRTADVVSDRVSQAVLPLVLQGLGLVALAALAGLLLARRLSRPFRELAEAARGLGMGRLHPDVPDYRVPEARAIGRALTGAGQKLDLLLTRERELAVHASHQLRTPVTALRLELEDLALWPDTPPTVAAELDRCVGELDRLSGAITDLLALSETRRRELAIDLDLDALVADIAHRLRTAGLDVSHDKGDPVPNRLDPGLVTGVVERLVDEVLAGGAARVVLSVAVHGTHDEVRVAGDADGTAEPPAREGWAAAAELAAAGGGQIGREGGTLVLRLPRREVAAADPGGGA
jgi:signal transduction histidine kinase